MRRGPRKNQTTAGSPSGERRGNYGKHGKVNRKSHAIHFDQDTLVVLWRKAIEDKCSVAVVVRHLVRRGLLTSR